MPLEKVLATTKGLVLAPAGCGKTQLIIEALRHSAPKPKLVLTHTTAGVAALRQRLRAHQVPSSNYRISTIAGWALNISAMFPARSNFLSSANAQPDYVNLQRKITALIQSGHIADIIQASYSNLLVDEYQDCSTSQHNLICALSDLLPTVVFGDPIQAIFGFSKGDPLPDWSTQVETVFPIITELDTPWRWINAGNPELGQWILSVREAFSAGNKIDLNDSPASVQWHQLSGNPIADKQLQISTQYQLRNNMQPTESLLVIGDSTRPSSRHDFAKSTQGIDVVEPVDLKDIVSALGNLERATSNNLLEQVLTVAATIMTGVDKTNLLKRISTITEGRSRKAPSKIELEATTLLNSNSPASILKFLTVLESSSNTKTFRSAALSTLKDALQLSISQPDKSLGESAIVIREKRRQQGDKRISKRAIGSTLLLKGLEADHVLILNVSQMDAKNLYVALSRGAKSITLFS